MYDKLILDILDAKNHKILNKIGALNSAPQKLRRASLSTVYED